MSATPTCTSCGGPRNRYVDGKLQSKCTSCHDRKSAKTVPGTPTPASAPLASSLFARKQTSTTPHSPDADAVSLLQLIDDLVDDEAYAWAESTLSGIRDTVERTGRCTDGQRQAVENIERAGMRKGGRR